MSSMATERNACKALFADVFGDALPVRLPLCWDQRKRRRRAAAAAAAGAAAAPWPNSYNPSCCNNGVENKYCQGKPSTQMR